MMLKARVFLCVWIVWISPQRKGKKSKQIVFCVLIKLTGFTEKKKTSNKKQKKKTNFECSYKKNFVWTKFFMSVHLEKMKEKPCHRPQICEYIANYYLKRTKL